MIPPRQQWCLEIDVTNACPRRCSNCTRLTAHVSKPFFMTADCFKEAVIALKDFPTQSESPLYEPRKSLGVIGGEPLLHPQFPDLCEILRQYGPGRQYVTLFTGLPVDKHKHRKLIYDTFEHVNENRHDQLCKHQPLLCAAEEMVPDKTEHWQLIDQCWINHRWSASVNPKGFFFCEIAATLDMIFHGPGGVPVTADVWRQDIDYFREQIKRWCPRCGVALPMPGRVDAEEKDDCTPKNFAALGTLGSPGIHRCILQQTKGYDPDEHRANWEPQRYLKEAPYPMRKLALAREAKSLQDVRALTVCVNYDDLLALTLPNMKRHFGEIWVITTVDDTPTQNLAIRHGVRLYTSPAFTEDGAHFNKGRAIEECLDLMGRRGWLAVIDADILLRPKLPTATLEPGSLYSARRRICEDVSAWQPGMAWRDFPLWSEVEYSGFLHVFHADDPMLKGLPWYGTTWRHAGGCDSEFQSRWDQGHKRALPWDVLHFGPIDTNWCGRTSPRRDSLALTDSKSNQQQEVIATYRSHEFAKHRLIDPERVLALRIEASEPALVERARLRLALCQQCRSYRGDWCWDTSGPGNSTDNFVARLLGGTCAQGNMLE